MVTTNRAHDVDLRRVGRASRASGERRRGLRALSHVFPHDNLGEGSRSFTLEEVRRSLRLHHETKSLKYLDVPGFANRTKNHREATTAPGDGLHFLEKRSRNTLSLKTAGARRVREARHVSRRFLHMLNDTGRWLLTPDAKRAWIPDGGGLLVSLMQSSYLLRELRIRFVNLRFNRSQFPWERNSCLCRCVARRDMVRYRNPSPSHA